MTGWMKHRLPASALLLCTAIAAAGPVTAPEATTQHKTPGTDRETHDPDEGLLAFLGEWSDDEGNWQDPLEFDDRAWSRTGDRQEKEHE